MDMFSLSNVSYDIVVILYWTSVCIVRVMRVQYNGNGEI